MKINNMKTSQIFSTLICICFATVMYSQVPSVPKRPGTPNTSSTSNYGDARVINRNLEIINNAYRDYNTYNTVFSVQGKTLHWKSSVTEASVPFENLTFYIHYKNGWMVLKCIEENCFQGTSSTKQYSMSLKDGNGNLAPVAEIVLQAFNTIRGEVLKN